MSISRHITFLLHHSYILFIPEHHTYVTHITSMSSLIHIVLRHLRDHIAHVTVFFVVVLTAALATLTCSSVQRRTCDCVPLE